MKSCPVCDTDYPDQHTTCPTDGAVLIVSQELAPGNLVRGKYRIVRKLGQGGMGVVYLADDILLGVRVALKFLAGDLGKDPKFIKRFRMEARAAYQLRHPNIVEVTNLDQSEDGSLFIAMEFVEGPSLRTVLEQAGALDIPRALAIARDIASGLAAAHMQGTVHRDIKPENILLIQAADGREKPKILDFGIAAVTESVTRLSMTRGFLLTPDYAAPEQWLEMPADEMDGRTDLYALGCVLYEMLTGAKPFHAHNTSGLMKQHLEETPKPPSVFRPELANWQGLDVLALRLLAKDRDQRPKDAIELLTLLDAVRYVPVEERQETILEDTRKKRTETVVEKDGVRPKPTTEQTQAAPALAIAISDHSSVPSSYQLFSELDSGSEGFPRWVWAALAILVLATSFAAWRFFAPHPQPQQAPAPPTQPVSQQVPVSQQPEQVTNPNPSGQVPGPSGQEKAALAENTKPTVQAPGLQLKPNPVPTESSKVPVPKPEVAEQPKPAPVENPKSPVAGPSNADIWQQAEALDKQQRYAEAAPLYDKACSGGNGVACRQLGKMYYLGQVGEKDVSRAVDLYTKACNADDAEACESLSGGYYNGTNVIQNTPKAVSLASKGCELGLATSCGGLGIIYDHVHGDPALLGVDSSRALALISKGCEASNLRSCNALGNAYMNALGVPRDYSRGLALYNKACDGGFAISCGSLGKCYQHGIGVAADAEKARQLDSKACAMGYQPSCDH